MYNIILTECNDGTPYTSEVASFKANSWGLYDMTGNIREYVSDAWEDSYDSGPYTEQPRTDGIEQFVVLRGGAWNYMPQNQRIAYRSAYYSLPMRSNMWGIRLVRDVSLLATKEASQDTALKLINQKIRMEHESDDQAINRY